MQAIYQAFEDFSGAEQRPCQTVLVGALGVTPYWHDAAGKLRLPLLQAPTVEEADRALASESPAVVVAPLALFMDGASMESACRWLSTAAVVVVTDTEANAALWRQLAWDALTPPPSADVAAATLTRALTEANRRSKQRQLIATYAHRLASLTRNERDVLDAVCEGRLNKQIASELNVSVRTIEQRRRRVFDKMGVDSAVPLAALTAVVQTLSEQNNRRRRAPSPPPTLPRMHHAAMPPSATPMVLASLAIAGMN
ncbi:response regulator transcription factor [Botrimarina mediterranea]|uniref:Tetrathionate response regulatory protein TtrR n=1 Tax=Botrimarina mediterranea TaxID=2528022 RepID=A0A518KEZ8_9BACT|nr:LuxR C-terminal-related transcriptional regulator [Botrimarina mediterranea]QDV76358.1 Tetrathionate response regulatory protein TtrR [Botrimarina mediterranea]QDV80956.1 Tetrathionate response regulatory protein TtrR [Planctomycetes bacterium K2D]